MAFMKPLIELFVKKKTPNEPTDRPTDYWTNLDVGDPCQITRSFKIGFPGVYE